jgi:hypothetical protein
VTNPGYKKIIENQFSLTNQSPVAGGPLLPGGSGGPLSSAMFSSAAGLRAAPTGRTSSTTSRPPRSPEQRSRTRRPSGTPSRSSPRKPTRALPALTYNGTTYSGVRLAASRASGRTGSRISACMRTTSELRATTPRTASTSPTASRRHPRRRVLHRQGDHRPDDLQLLQEAPRRPEQARVEELDRRSTSRSTRPSSTTASALRSPTTSSSTRRVRNPGWKGELCDRHRRQPDLCDGTPNPNVGRPYVGRASGGEDNNYQTTTTRQVWRFTPTVELRASDFFGSNSTLAKILGKSDFTGLYEKNTVVQSTFQFAEYATTQATRRQRPRTRVAANAIGPNRSFEWLAYIGPSLLNASSPRVRT